MNGNSGNLLPVKPIPGLSGLLEKRWVHKLAYVSGRLIPVIRTRLSAGDRLGAVRVRLGIGRMSYRVPAGLYAAGNPSPESPVFVTANYKLSFDSLRKELKGIDCFILVLDTKGINVWCAAGKGTFGTKELVRRIQSSGLAQVVEHRTIILPQLGASGVSAHLVKRDSGFRVMYGPVRAADIPAYISSGFTKTQAMREVLFPFIERVKLVPVEVKGILWAAIGFLAFAAVVGFIREKTIASSFRIAVPYLGALVTGCALTPALLPVLPFRALSLKGAVLGILWGLSCALFLRGDFLSAVSNVLLCGAISAFLALNFTGATTYTSPHGADLEVKRGVPLMALSVLAGVVILFL